MQGGGVPGLGAVHGIGAGEQAFIGHVDGVGGRAIIGALAAGFDPGAGVRQKAIGRLDARDGTQGFGRFPTA